MDKYESGRQAPFLQLPLELLVDPDIDPFALAAWAALKSFCDYGSEDGARPSDTKAAQRGGMSRRVFMERRNILRDRGWIEWTRTGKANHYIVHASLHNATALDPQRSEDRQEVPIRCAGDAYRDRQEMPTTYISVTKTSIPKTRMSDLEKFATELDDLWEFWEKWRARALEIRSPVSQKATWKRIRPVLDRLGEGYQVADLKEAVLGACHREHNVAGGYLDIELICRDQQHVDMYVHHWRQVKGAGGSTTVEQTKVALEAIYG